MKNYPGITLFEVTIVTVLSLLIFSSLAYSLSSFTSTGKIIQTKIQKNQWSNILNDFYEANYADIIYHPKFILRTKNTTPPLTVTLGVSPGEAANSLFNDGYRCSEDPAIFSLLQDGRDEFEPVDAWKKPLRFCMGHIFNQGSIEGFNIPNRKLAIYFAGPSGISITMKHPTNDLCIAGSGNFVCNNGAGIFLKKLKNTKKKVAVLYERLESYAKDEFTFGQDGGHIDYFHNFIETNSSTATVTLRAPPRWNSRSRVWIPGAATATTYNLSYEVVKPDWLRPYNSSSGGIKRNRCIHEPVDLLGGVVSKERPKPFIVGQCSGDSSARAALAYNFDYYNVVFTQTIESTPQKKTVYLKHELGVADEDIFDDFGGPILFDNSSAATRNPYHLDYTKRRPPFNARIVATIPQVAKSYFNGFAGTVIMNKYEPTISISGLAPASAIPSIRAYNRGMNRLRGVIEAYSCYDPYIEDLKPYSYSYKISERNCGNNLGHVFRAPDNNIPIANVNYMKYPVKLYEKYIESPY